MADNAHKLTDEKLEQMERHLSAIYSRAGKEVQATADAYFEKFKAMDAKKRKLVEAGKLDPDEYKRWRQNKILYAGRFTDLKEQLAQELLNANKTAVDYINGELPEVYALNYNAMGEVVDGVGGYSFTLTDAGTIRHLALSDSSLLPFKEIDPEKDIPWNMKKINTEVLQGIIQGESIPKIAARIGNVQDMNRVAAVRTARTIVTEAENKGRLDSYEKAQSDGIILQKEWISSDQPGRTRDWHMPDAFENLIVDIDQPFVNSLGPIRFPGDHTAAGANVYNCRCTMGAVVKGFKKISTPKKEQEKPKFNNKKFAEDVMMYIGGGYDIDDIFNKSELAYIKENMKTTTKPLYRIEEAEFTANLLDEDILDVDDFKFSGTYRSFSRGTEVYKSALDEMSMEAPVIFETVGKVKHFNVDKFAGNYMDDQKESFVGGSFKVVGEDMRLINGQFVRIIKIKQL